MIKSVADIEAASDAVLRAYLTAEKVQFSKDALRPELIADARAHFIEKNPAAKEPDPVVPPQKAAAPKIEEPKVLPETMTAQEALQELHNRGFRDREEIIAFLNVQDREKTDVKNQKAVLQATIEDIELRELQFKDREKELEKKAVAVREDMKKQENLYEKLKALKESFPAGTDLNV